jgi:hypothetical protein
MLLSQTIFLLILFRKAEANFYLEGLLGLKYSLGVEIFGSQASSTVTNTHGYLYSINSESFLSNFNLNFLLLLVPALLSPLFMLYRIKNKHMPLKNDMGKEAAEFLIGYTLLYFVAFNFNALVSYGFLYFQSPLQH